MLQALAVRLRCLGCPGCSGEGVMPLLSGFRVKCSLSPALGMLEEEGARCWSLVLTSDSENPGKWVAEGLEAFLVSARGRRELRTAPASRARCPCHVPAPPPSLVPFCQAPREGRGAPEELLEPWEGRGSARSPKQPRSGGLARCQRSDRPAPRLSGGDIPKQVGSQGKMSKREGNSPPVFPAAGEKAQCPRIAARRGAGPRSPCGGTAQGRGRARQGSLQP